MKNPPAASFLRQAVFAFGESIGTSQNAQAAGRPGLRVFSIEGARKTQAIFIKDGLLVRAAAVQEGFSGTAPEKITR